MYVEPHHAFASSSSALHPHHYQSIYPARAPLLSLPASSCTPSSARPPPATPDCHTPGTVGLSFGPEVTAESSKAVLSEDASKDEQRAAFATAAEVSVKEMYAKLLAIEAEKETAK